MRRSLRILAVGALLGGAATMAAACATRGDIDFLSEEHRRIVDRQEALESRVASLEETMRRLQDLLTGIRADFKADLSAVRREVASLTAAVRGTETRIEELGRRPEPVRPTPADTNGQAVTGSDMVALYNGALTDYQQGRLELAREGFAEYVERFPQGPSAPDAQYWLGIVEYDQGRYDAAIDELRVIPARYPDTSKAPLALRKIGDAYRALGDTARARTAYRALIDRYPNSSEAEAARRELDALR